ncbi:MAG: hypothetical protein CfP315_0354 [Candidatus Improbicoccus pseudotrichonymphae]|uniref:Uncharacterized protein n=1 Tax=Candidatus Improbicoccus pseudotrichonymphae TaxID=3033792 RepID=A0AA48I2N9_9FIRM|nr:MAG: hypothetical protein CfP315_0354 [Candidatus Improbicoccus pseudotrichonymphae]
MKELLAKKEEESGDYNSTREFLIKNDNIKILMDFFGATTQGSIFLAPLASNINLLSTFRQIISGMLRAGIKIDALSKENSNLRTENSYLRNEINELKQKERKLED